MPRSPKRGNLLPSRCCPNKLYQGKQSGAPLGRIELSYRFGDRNDKFADQTIRSLGAIEALGRGSDDGGMPGLDQWTWHLNQDELVSVRHFLLERLFAIEKRKIVLSQNTFSFCLPQCRSARHLHDQRNRCARRANSPGDDARTCRPYM